MLFRFIEINFVILNRIVSIVLLAVLIACNTEFHQLMKIPVLIQHFYKHKMDNNELSFLDFISEHYRMDVNEHSDQDHHGLPFKSHECQHMNSLLLIDFQLCAFKMEIPELEFQKSFFKEDFYNSAGRSAIWQPPQFS